MLFRSKDKGYEILTVFWQKYKNLNSQVTLVSDLSLKNDQEEKKKLNSSIQSVLSDSSFKDLQNDIFIIIEKYKTKQGIYNALVKNYEQKKGSDIYKKIKPLLIDKKGA